MTAAAASPDGQRKPRLILIGGEAGEQAAPATVEELTAELYRVHGRPLLRFAQKLTLGDTQRAEDIVQETLLRAWRHPEVLRAGTEKIRPWLFTVARRIAIDMWRTRARGEELVDNQQADACDPADLITQAITALDVRAALATLSAEHRRVIVEMYYRSRSVAEAAENLGIPEGTVKSRTYYGMRALRRALHDLGYDGKESAIAAGRVS